MAVNLFKVSTSNAFSTTLNGTITDSTNSITLTTVSGLQAPGVLVVDRVDSNGTSTPVVREYISFTGISGSQITGCSRGLGGSTAQSHNSGSVVEEAWSVSHWNDFLDTYAVSHDVSGNIVSTSTATLTNIRLLTNLNASGASVVTSDFTVTRYLNASGASIVGISATGGLNALFQVPGSLPTTATDIMGSIPVPTAYTFNFMNAYLRTPCSGASLLLTVKKYPSTTIGVIGMLAGATFASSASISNAVLSAGDVLVGDITTSNNAYDLSLLIRAS